MNVLVACYLWGMGFATGMEADRPGWRSFAASFALAALWPILWPVAIARGVRYRRRFRRHPERYVVRGGKP